MAETTPISIASGTRYMGGAAYRSVAAPALGTSTAWPSANLGIYIPFSLPWGYTVNRLFVNNGTTANGNVTMGIYSIAGSRLGFVAATAQTGTSTLQYLSLGSPLTLAAGNYYLALALSSATGTVNAGTTTTAHLRSMGFYQQASAIPLPATWTLAAHAQTFYPLVGITRASSGF